MNVRFGSLADVSERTRDVRFTSESGHAERQHRRPLSAKSGHRRSCEQSLKFWRSRPWVVVVNSRVSAQLVEAISVTESAWLCPQCCAKGGRLKSSSAPALRPLWTRHGHKNRLDTSRLDFAVTRGQEFESLRARHFLKLNPVLVCWAARM